MFSRLEAKRERRNPVRIGMVTTRRVRKASEAGKIMLYVVERS
jgi:hypothetical protein